MGLGLYVPVGPQQQRWLYSPEEKISNVLDKKPGMAGAFFLFPPPPPPPVPPALVEVSREAAASSSDVSVVVEGRRRWEGVVRVRPEERLEEEEEEDVRRAMRGWVVSVSVGLLPERVMAPSRSRLMGGIFWGCGLVWGGGSRDGLPLPFPLFTFWEGRGCGLVLLRLCGGCVERRR